MAPQSLTTNNERIEITILRNLIFNEDYTRKTLPFINEIYFTKRDEQILFQEINTFVEKYKNLPTRETLLIELGYRKDVNDEEVRSVKDLLSTLNAEEVEPKWLLDTT